jgi:type I restriction enzyme S subunit
MSWLMTQIGQFTHVVTKGTTPTKKQGFADSGINYIKAEALNGDSTLDLSGGFFISEDVHQSLKRSVLEEGDVLLTIAGANIGKCGIVEERHLPANTNQAVGIMRVDQQQVTPRYLYYWFKQPQTFRYIQGLNAQAAQPNINLSMLRNIEVPVPSISEQKRIADTLFAYDDLIENNRRRIQLLEQAARLLYKEWFVHFRFPGHEHTQIIDGVPEGWGKKTLGDVCIEVRETVSPNVLEPHTPYIGLEHMPRRSITLCEWGQAEQVTSSKHRFREGEILFGKIRPYFHKVGIAFTDGVASSDAIIIRPVNQQLLALVLMTTSSDGFVAVTAQQMKEGSKMPRADWKQMQQYPVPLPPDGLLRAFNDFIDPILNQLKTLAFANKRLSAARDLLLPKLMNGEVAV